VTLDDLSKLAPTAHTARLTVIAEQGAALTEARSCATRHAKALPVALWRIPGEGARLGDISVDIADGEAVKRAALHRLDGSDEVAPREVFRVEGADA